MSIVTAGGENLFREIEFLRVFFVFSWEKTRENRFHEIFTNFVLIDILHGLVIMN